MEEKAKADEYFALVRNYFSCQVYPEGKVNIVLEPILVK